MKNRGNIGVREYRNYLPDYLSKLKMKNSFKNNEDEAKEKVDDRDSGLDLLRIHCIVQAISRIEDVKSGECQFCDDKANLSVNNNWWECDCNNVEMSGCVSVSQSTGIRDVVKTVLLKLGYPSSLCSYASGSILIRNWKPLPLTTVCPAMNKTIGEIFGELTAIVSLRIQIFRPISTAVETIKDGLLNYLVRSNQNFLGSSGCPFDVATLLKYSNPSNRKLKQFFQDPSNEMYNKFEAWLKHIQETQKEATKPKTQPQPPPPDSNAYLDKSYMKNGLSVACLKNAFEPLTQLKSDLSGRPETPENVKKESSKDKMGILPKESSDSFNVGEKPKMSMAAPKTRIRTSFDPELELPKLHKWYLENPHPSRQQIYEYVSELNSLESRRGRKQLDVNNVLYWFKNARAAQKRTECRKIVIPGTNAHRGNVLKIPMGKTSGISSDDQRSLSDEEVSNASEPEQEYARGKDRCLQVVGKWNSNGQGEAVLEMQIGSSPKNEFVQSNAAPKEDFKKEKEAEECLKSENFNDNEGNADLGQQISTPEKKELFIESDGEGDVKETEASNLMDKNQMEMRNFEKFKGSKTKQTISNDAKKEVSSSNIQLRSRFPMYKENCGANEPPFMPPYNSGISNLFEHSLMCMSQYMNSKANASGNLPLTADERRKRNRTFIDPVTEVPRLEEWFRLSTHPSHNLIARYTDELNGMPYRRKFPKLETKNVQFWFKNRRAKNKRLNYLEINSK